MHTVKTEARPIHRTARRACRSTPHGARPSLLRSQLPPAPSQRDIGSHRLPSPSAPGSVCLRPLFLRTIAPLPSFLRLRREFGALSPTLARPKLRPMGRHDAQASGGVGTGPAPPRPSVLQSSAERGGWVAGIGRKYCGFWASARWPGPAC